MLDILPKNKEDIIFIKNLEKLPIAEVLESVPELLEWLQDGNWPQASLIGNYLSPYLNIIKEPIISILKGNDDIWKYWVLHIMIKPSINIPSKELLKVIENLYLNPSDFEKEESIHIIAEQILIKFGYISQ